MTRLQANRFWKDVGKRLEEHQAIRRMGIGVGIGPHLKPNGKQPKRAVQRYKVRSVGCRCVMLVAC